MSDRCPICHGHGCLPTTETTIVVVCPRCNGRGCVGIIPLPHWRSQDKTVEEPDDKSRA